MSEERERGKPSVINEKVGTLTAGTEKGKSTKVARNKKKRQQPPSVIKQQR